MHHNKQPCERCGELFSLMMLTHAAAAWKPGVHFVCRPCKAIIREEVRTDAPEGEAG